MAWSDRQAVTWSARVTESSAAKIWAVTWTDWDEVQDAAAAELYSPPEAYSNQSVEVRTECRE